MRTTGKFIFLSVVIFSLSMVSSCERGCDRFRANPQTPTPDTAVEKQGYEQDKDARETDHHRNRLRTEWVQLKDKVRAQWDRLTDEDINRVDGNFDELSARLQERYQRSKEESDQSIKDFLDQNK